MHHRLVLAAIACLFVTGCAGNRSLVDHDPYNEPQTVYIWDGTKCVEATKTAEQLRKMEMHFYSSVSRANGEERRAAVWAKPSDMEVITTHGGSIPLPNGEEITFPGKGADGPAVVSNGRLNLKNGQSVPVDPAIPDGTVLEHQSFDKATLLDPQAFAAEKAAFHSAQATATKDGIKIPPQSSVNGRVGSVSMSYGMGQISK